MIEEVSNFSPAIAVPTTVKIPEPITAPTPSAVSESGPSVFFKQCSGRSESLISLSIDLVAKTCVPRCVAPAFEVWCTSLNTQKQQPMQANSPSHPRVPQVREANLGFLSAEAGAPHLAFQMWVYPYRLLAPLLAFFSFCLFSPRAPVLGAFGAAFFRAARLTAFRSALSSIFVVFAILSSGAVIPRYSLAKSP